MLEPVNLPTLIPGITKKYPHFHKEKVDIVFEGALKMVVGNGALLTQCFSNLLENAVKFVGPGVKPQLRVKAEVSEGMAKIWICDNGIGIPRAAQKRLFKMFQRLDESYGGNGIGLAIVHKAVERMNGSAGVESEEGEGSKFWVKLPLDGGAESDAT